VNRGRIEVRDRVVIDSRFSPVELVSRPGGSIVVGEGSSVEHGSMLVAAKLVELGDGVTVGPYCVLSDTDGPEPAALAAAEEARPIWVGDGVVVGARVTILPGAVIGAGSHILPGSMVSGEIPPGVVAGGNPARPVRKLPAAGEAGSGAAGAVGVTAGATGLPR
jgi:acetyltransferase-like isoleucine patch superfamily enzyme